MKLKSDAKVSRFLARSKLLGTIFLDLLRHDFLFATDALNCSVSCRIKGERILDRKVVSFSILVGC
jgi:hypothetical protein